MPDPDGLAGVRAPDLEVIQQLHELILSRENCEGIQHSLAHVLSGMGFLE